VTVFVKLVYLVTNITYKKQHVIAHVYIVIQYSHKTKLCYVFFY